MSGIFGSTAPAGLDDRSIKILTKHAEQRGRDSSGLVAHKSGEYQVFRADLVIDKVLKRCPLAGVDVFIGHSSLSTNVTSDIQPVVRDNVAVIHNGIIVNANEIWAEIPKDRKLTIDSEIIPALLSHQVESGSTAEEAAAHVLSLAKGAISAAAVLPKLGKLVLFSNTGSLYAGTKAGGTVFSSERFPLEQIEATGIRQVRDPEVIDIPAEPSGFDVLEHRRQTIAPTPGLNLSAVEEKMLEYPTPNFRRCTKCILPETMPFIRFDKNGVCNYCTSYKPRNQPRPKEELFELVEPYRRGHGDEVLVPFSGGRDSCYGLHLIVNELGLRPITYTYDWGMVTDLGHRNISRMTAALGVENIVVAPDVNKKRDNIRRNLTAWLKAPNLGMLSMLTAGDKHFFRHIETVKQQTGLSLNLWGINPLEVTHFKSGFLGVPPDFEEERVYSHGAMKQLRYQNLRFRAMSKSPGYFNRSLWDTLSGEYYRSFTKKSDYYHIFDFWRWDEEQIDNTLLNQYDWEKAPDTSTTWRIGDATAAFYNYVYYTVAGFTEHDTFRSNQVREGDITREEALRFVADENTPRYQNLRWYLDLVGVDFNDAIRVVNSMPRLYNT